MEHFLQYPKPLLCKPSDLDIIVLLKDEYPGQKRIPDDDTFYSHRIIEDIVEAQIPPAKLTKRMLSRIQMKHVFLHGSHGDARLFMCGSTCKYRKYDF